VTYEAKCDIGTEIGVFTNYNVMEEYLLYKYLIVDMQVIENVIIIDNKLIDRTCPYTNLM